MKQLILFLSIILGFSIQLNAQEPHDYHPPLKIPLVLSANFGELRPNHFHMGLDFKTNNKIGYRIYSIEEGFVSRIKVSSYGYGKVVYVDHPNGMTSVYAHCSEFKGEIDSIVKATQKQEQSFEVEIFPSKNTLKVEKGDVIAISGNTGGSTAPHLHFEIRETSTEHALNPLLCGFDIEDHKAPEIRGVKIYSITDDGYRIPNKELVRSSFKSGSNYAISGNEVTIPSSFCNKNGGIGFAFDVIDRFDAASNQCGLFGSYLVVDGDTIFGQRVDRVPFESTRYVNSHKDYEDYQKLRKKYHKSFKTNENDLPFYTINSNGVVKTSPGDDLNVQYITYDVKGNKSILEFKLKVSEGEISDFNFVDANYNAFPNQGVDFTSEKAVIDMGIACVYEPAIIDTNSIDHKVLQPLTPVNRPYILKRKASQNDDKYYFEFITSKGSKRAIKAIVDNGWAVAESKYFGNYQLKRDEVAPTIISHNIKGTSIYSTSLIWRISDDASGLKEYDVFIDGEWILGEYEYKNDQLIVDRSNIKGLHEVKVIVTDNCGNKQEWIKDLEFH